MTVIGRLVWRLYLVLSSMLFIFVREIILVSNVKRVAICMIGCGALTASSDRCFEVQVKCEAAIIRFMLPGDLQAQFSRANTCSR